MKRWGFFTMMVVLIVSAGFVAETKGKDGAMLQVQAQKVINDYVVQYAPLTIELRKQWWIYNTTGDKRASDRMAKLDLEIRTLDSDPKRFAELKKLYKSRARIPDDIVRRQVELLYFAHLPNQVPPKKLKRLVELEQRLQEAFNDYRPVVDGKKLSPVETKHILSDSVDSDRLEKVWKAEKAIGAELEPDFRALVELRNEIARDLGYKNALELASVTAEMDIAMLDRFYREVKRATDKPFRKLKREYIDPRLAKHYGIAPDAVRPWHYQNAFFQEAPNAIFDAVDLDRFYAKKSSRDVIRLTRDFYASFGVDVSGILKRSSLYPKPGKNPHAFAELLNPNDATSAVLLMNLPRSPKHPKASEASTLVHELGHDINYVAIVKNGGLPFLLRDPTMLTESFAMLMEGQTRTAEWFQKLGAPKAQAVAAAQGVELIDYVEQMIFLRWSSAIYCFERSFYGNPKQDIGDLWWECKAEHQLLERPEGWKNPDALAKYHIPNVPPLYYSNYAIGTVANVQFADLFAKRVGQEPQGASYFNQQSLGDWLMEDFLAQGQRYPWMEYLERTTGSKLSVKPWKRYYVDGDFDDRLFSTK